MPMTHETLKNMTLRSPAPKQHVRRRLVQVSALLVGLSICTMLSACFAAAALRAAANADPIHLDDRINPNDAPRASLVRLPGIGLSRAEAIVAFRRLEAEKPENDAAFANSIDLQKVKGIGPKTAEKMKRWLSFD